MMWAWIAKFAHPSMQKDEWEALQPEDADEKFLNSLPPSPIIHFKAGPEGPEALGQELMKMAPHLAACLMEVDTEHGPSHDILEKRTYNAIMHLARKGTIRAIVAIWPDQIQPTALNLEELRFLLILAVAVEAANTPFYVDHTSEKRLKASESNLIEENTSEMNASCIIILRFVK